MENPLFLRGPLFQLTPLFLSNFFMTTPFVQISKTRPPPPPPPPLILGGGGNYSCIYASMYVCICMHACMYVFCFFRFDLHIALQIFVTCVFYLGFVVANLKTIKKY